MNLIINPKIQYNKYTSYDKRMPMFSNMGGENGTYSTISRNNKEGKKLYWKKQKERLRRGLKSVYRLCLDIRMVRCGISDIPGKRN